MKNHGLGVAEPIEGKRSRETAVISEIAGVVKHCGIVPENNAR